MIKSFAGQTWKESGFKALPEGLWVWPLALGVVVARLWVFTSKKRKGNESSHERLNVCFILVSVFCVFLLLWAKCHIRNRQMKKIQQSDDLSWALWLNLVKATVSFYLYVRIKHVLFKYFTHYGPCTSIRHWFLYNTSTRWKFRIKNVCFLILHMLSKENRKNVPVTLTTKTNMAMVEETVIMNLWKRVKNGGRVASRDACEDIKFITKCE